MPLLVKAMVKHINKKKKKKKKIKLKFKTNIMRKTIFTLIALFATIGLWAQTQQVF